MKENFRRTSSYVMLPVMAMYLLGPSITYGAQASYVQTNSNMQQEGTSATDTKSLNEAAEAGKKINEANGKKSNLLGASEQGSSESSSYASNMTVGVGAEVNPQTGQLDLTISNVKLPGITQEMDISLGLSNNGGATPILGLPAGWKFNIDYIDTTAKKLYMGSGQSYAIDDTFYSLRPSDGTKYYSGLKYCTQLSIKFEAAVKNPDGKYPSIPYGDSSRQYAYILTGLGGTHEYFGPDGKLRCYDDRFGNHIDYKYDSELANAYNSKLVSIIDSFGQEIEVKFDTLLTPPTEVHTIGVHTIKMPDGRTAVYDLRYLKSANYFTVTDLTGLKATIGVTSSKNNRVEYIDYPTKGRTKYVWSEKAIKYLPPGYSPASYEWFPAVTAMIQAPVATDTKMENSSNIVTQYSYGENNFTGYPHEYDTVNSADPLMQGTSNHQADQTYTYNTTVTSYRNGDATVGNDVATATTYNFLHIPTSGKVSQNGNVLHSTNTKYMGQDESGYFKAYNNLQPNYNLPKLVTDSVRNGTVAREHKVSTSFDDYGHSVDVSEYNNGDLTLSTKSTYDNSHYGLQTEQKITDKIENCTYTASGMLSSDGKYVEVSKNTKSSSMLMAGASSNDKETVKKLDAHGRKVASTVRFAAMNALKSDGNPTSSTSEANYSLDGNLLTITQKDDNGNTVTSVTDIRNGMVQSQTDALEHTVNYEYSNNGLIVTQKNPDGSWATTDSSDHTVTVTTASNGIVKKSYLDGLGISTAAIREMSAEEQLKPGGIIEQYFRDAKGMAGFDNNQQLNGAEVYSLVFAPANARKGILYAEGSSEYNANPGPARIAKANGHSGITSGDLAEFAGMKTKADSSNTAFA